MKKAIVGLTALGLVLCMLLAGCKQEVQQVESKVEGVLESVIETIKADAEAVLEKLEMKGSAALEVLKEDEKTVRYQITVLEGEAEAEAAELEQRVRDVEAHFVERLEELKEKGLAEARVIVSFVNEKGEELYSRIFE